MQNDDNKPLVFVNKPIDEEKDDIVGFSSQVSTICESIKNGATMIGVVADYGTGKSSLTELLGKTVKKKPFKYPNPIKINMWDCLQATDTSSEKSKTDREVSELTKTFLYQLACGNEKKNRFSSYINKRLSKNYGNVSFSVSSRKFWGWFIFAVLFYALYAICSQDYKNFDGVVKNETVLNVLRFCCSFHPIFLVGAIIMLIFGIIDTCVAFSHWKESGPRDTEVNDVFDVYQSIVRHIKPCTKKKQIIIIEDLDRVVEKSIIIGFLKEIYRFQNSAKPYTDRFAFVVSIKPEAQLRNDNELVIDDKKAYSKIFDTIVPLKPIHYDDYDSLLLKLINSDPNKKQRLENIIGEEISGAVLPESFAWIKTGENLSLRDLKDRLNHALMIMSSRKSYKVKTDVSFEACAAVTYLECQYPEEYYWLIAHEKKFAELMKKSVDIINTDKAQEAQSKLAEELKSIYAGFPSEKLHPDFVKDLCILIYNGTFNYDFRMYFYTYPVGSPVKTTEERELCDMLLMPVRYHNFDEIESIAERVYADGDDNVVTSTLKGMKTYPEAVIMSSTLLRVACEFSWGAVAETIDKYVIKRMVPDKYAIDFWTRLHDLRFSEKSALIEKINASLVDGSATTDSVILARKQIIQAFGKGILCFRDIFDRGRNRVIPLISEEEISLINNASISIQLIDPDNLSTSDFGYVSKLLCSEKLADVYDAEFQKAISVFRVYGSLKPANLADALLSFMDINLYSDDDFFEKVCLGCEKDRIAQYVNKLDAENLSDKYLSEIDNLGFSNGLSKNIISVLVEKKFYHTVLLCCAESGDFSPMERHLDNDVEILNACKTIWESEPDHFYAIRWYLCIERRDDQYRSLFYDNFPLITEQEYLAIENNKAAIRCINTKSDEPIDYSSLLSIIYAKEYSAEELVCLFNWLFDDDSSIPLDNSVFADIVDEMDFRKLNIRKLDEADRETVYGLVKPVFDRNRLSYAARLQKFGCLIPSAEEEMVKNGNASDEYFSLLQEFDEFTSFSLEYLSGKYITVGLSDKLSRKLKEKRDYKNYITASVLRENNMIIDTEVPFDQYVNVYINVPEMYDIMSDHWDFLEGLQTEPYLQLLFDSERNDELIPPIYKVPQHEKFFRFMLSERFSNTVKEKYLYRMGAFATESDSSAFKDLICKRPQIDLLGDRDMYWKIRNNFKQKTEKSVFSRNWNKHWGGKVRIYD